MLRRNLARGLVLTGGDTAVSVCRALGAAGVKVRDEVAPGVPLGQLIGGTWDGTSIVIKAGSFGDKNALLDAVRYLRSSNQEPEAAQQEQLAG